MPTRCPVLLAIPLLACASSPSPPVNSPQVLPVQQPACLGKFTGTGARPVSPTTVASWHINDGSLVYLLLLRGSPGWYNQKTQWNFGPDSVGQFIQRFDVGGFKYTITLDAKSERVEMLGVRLDLRSANVGYLERDRDGAALRGSELQAFCWSSPPDPVAELLERSPQSVAFVTARPPSP